MSQLGAGKLYGDVTVRFDRKQERWSRSASKSLDGLGGRDRPRACRTRSRGTSSDNSYDEGWPGRHADAQVRRSVCRSSCCLAIGEAAAGVAARAHRREGAWRAPAKLLPPDYQVTPDGCFRTDAPRDRERRVPVVADRRAVGAAAVGRSRWARCSAIRRTSRCGTRPASWSTKSPRGLCLVRVRCREADRAARRRWTRSARAWAGGFEDVLLHPHVALPAGVAYTQVATQTGRACALSTAGEITCCGRAGLPPPPKGRVHAGRRRRLVRRARSTAKGAADLLGRDRTRRRRARSRRSPRSTRTRAACGRPASSRAGAPATTTSRSRRPARSPTSRRRSSARAACTPTGAIECWGEPSRGTHPAGAFAHGRCRAGRTRAACARDGTLGCWRED